MELEREQRVVHIPQEAREQRLLMLECADGLEAIEELGELLDASHPPSPLRVAKMAGVKHGVKRYDLTPEPLQDELSHGVSDVAMSHMRLHRDKPWSLRARMMDGAFERHRRAS